MVGKSHAVAQAYGLTPTSRAHRDANARLIAASPQLLKAAHMAYLNLLRVHSAERHTLSYQAALCELREAIAAATGRDAESVQEEYEAATGSEQ